ncbi:MAG: hypothetical protein EBT92_10225 [Planctomycetes bacterium]|nr:hypothetical protein [Planctomycetota bacterium]
MRVLQLLILILLITSGSAVAEQQKKNAAVSKVTPVEIVVLKKGTELKGLTLGKTKSGNLVFAVQRSWLKKALPDQFEMFINNEKETSFAIQQDISKRMKLWIEESEKANKSKAWINYLQDEQKILQEKNPQNQQIYLFEIKPADVKKYSPVQPVVKQLLMVAWQERLADVENKTAGELSLELLQSKIDWQKEKIYLADRLPPMRVEDELDWSIRKALFAYKSQEGIHLQGTGDFLIDKNDNKGNGFAGIFQGVAQSILGDAMKELGLVQNLAKQASWPEQAAKIGNDKKVMALRVTRVVPELNAGKMSVEDTLLTNLPNGNWIPVWNSKLSADASQARPQAEAQIRNDPNVGAMLKQIEGFGLGNQLNLALRAGAATLELQAQSEVGFAEFLRMTSKRLDGPPIHWFVR